MKIEHKWNIPEDLLKNTFYNLGIEKEYYSIFVDRAHDYLNDWAKQFEPEPPDKKDFDDSIENAGDWVKIYAEQIKLGLSKLWAITYADYRVSWSKDDSANEAYNNVCKDFGEEEADRDLTIFAQSLCDDPIFVESYIQIFNDDFKDAEKRAHEYTNLYKSLIEKGKSPIYAEKYTICYLGNYLPVSCDLYASKYEECISKGIDGNKAGVIAEEYEYYCNPQFPQNEKDKEFADVYIKGYEYAIVNGIDSPEEFATEYQSTYYNNGKRPSLIVKGKYDDIISKLLANKV